MHLNATPAPQQPSAEPCADPGVPGEGYTHHLIQEDTPAAGKTVGSVIAGPVTTREVLAPLADLSGGEVSEEYYPEEYQAQEQGDDHQPFRPAWYEEWRIFHKPTRFEVPRRFGEASPVEFIP